MVRISNKATDHLIYTLLAIIIASIVGVIYVLAAKYRANMLNKEPISDNNQYLIIYSDHNHNAAIAQIDVGDDGSHIFRECKRTVDINGNIILELKFEEKKNITLETAVADLLEEVKE